MRFHLALIAAFVAAPAWATEQQPQRTEQTRQEPTAKQSKDEHDQGAKRAIKDEKGRTSDAREQKDSENIKGYGYGTQPAKEANEGAGQASAPSREKSKAPQDEQGAAADRAAEREGSGQAAKEASDAAPSSTPARSKAEHERGAKRAGKDEKGRTSDAREETDTEDIKGYGYGTQPAKEANEGAGQASAPSREKSKAPQDEQGAAADRAAEREGSGQAAKEASDATPSATHRDAGTGRPSDEPSYDSGTGRTAPSGTNTGSGGSSAPTSGSGTTGDTSR